LICGLLGLAAAAFGEERGAAASSDSQAWPDSPYRNFGAPQPMLSGRVLLFDEAAGGALTSALASELKSLAAELHEKQGWRVPFADGDPLKIYIARKEADGVRRLASRAIDRGHLVSPAIQLDATLLTDREILREVARLYALATLSSYGAPDRSFVTTAAAAYLSGGSERDEERELTREAAAAPSVNLSQRAAVLGRLYVEEFARAAGGPASLKAVWEKAAEAREEIAAALSKTFAELTGEKEERLLLRFAARLYATVESEASPSRISLEDLEDGRLDTSSPAVWTLRHRTFLPSAAAEAGAALRVAWPEDGAPAAAVVRYRDGSLPPDVVFFSAGDSRALPLSGVARVDWIVTAATGAGLSGSPLAAPAGVEAVSGLPFDGLLAHAAAGAEGSQLLWTTASHEGLAGWAVFREEVQPDGRIARTGPEIVPSSERAEDPFRYMYVDSATTPGTFYRYTVWAVTEEGALSRAFSATLRTAE
jgi:hypothetical protein